MRVDRRALREAAQDMFRSVGPLDDLGAEFSNTVANIYYRYHVMTQNMTDPGTALRVKAGRNMSSNYRNLTAAMGTALSEHKYIDRMVKRLRDAKAENPKAGDYLITYSLDHLKYHINNAEKKSRIRRAIERPFHKVDEIPRLYKRMAKAARAEQLDAR
jgi:hypothetical protein